jgi:hypothetical protein
MQLHSRFPNLSILVPAHDVSRSIDLIIVSLAPSRVRLLKEWEEDLRVAFVLHRILEYCLPTHPRPSFFLCPVPREIHAYRHDASSRFHALTNGVCKFRGALRVGGECIYLDASSLARTNLLEAIHPTKQPLKMVFHDGDVPSIVI